MSKYYKAEDVIRAFKEWLAISEAAEDIIADLPTIDAISREHLKSFEYINKGDFNSVETIREWIDNAPSVIPKEKEGEWIEDDDGYKKCSNCGEYAPLSFDDYYMRGRKIRQEDDLLLCSYCGAKMRIK